VRLLTVAALLASVFALAAPQGTASASQTYIVLYKGTSVPADAKASIARAGGQLVIAYKQIGVAIARSSSSSFRDAIARDSRVEGASSTAKFATKVKDVQASDDAATADGPVDDSDEPLWSLQWDMQRIRTAEAHAVTGGSSSIVVGDVDTGLDFTHPDLAPNYDAANSTDCSSGAPQPLLAGNDANGHGTHTAGTIAAAANDLGIVGVAPNVKIAGIKSSNDDGFFLPEMVICSYMWVGTHNIDVTNNSYFADPWLFNCRNDKEQHAIWKAEQRAMRFAQSNGTLIVASAGNENIDLNKRNTDTISPDFPEGNEQTREVTNACVVIPVEIPGVVGVSAVGYTGDKSFYSTYGQSAVDVTAPGGDSRRTNPPLIPNGRVLSTYPQAAACLPTRTVFDQGAKYCYLQGTSMAGPHAAGVAALIFSILGPDASSGSVAARLGNTAVPQPCPPSPYVVPPAGAEGEAFCTGGTGHNSFYGKGEVDALNAVGG
jgi:subtilisin family serine protease